MTALDTAVRSILFDTRLMRNRAFNGKRYQFTAGKMKETAKFALLRRFGWTVTDRSEGGAVIITVAPPETESSIFNCGLTPSLPNAPAISRRFQ